MKLFQQNLWIFGLALLVGTAAPVSAQHEKNRSSAKKRTAADTVLTTRPAAAPDSLLQVIDSLQQALHEMERHHEEQQEAMQRLRTENDNLKAAGGDCDMSYLMNYGNSLLYRKYHARAEDIATLLAAAPDSLKQKSYAEMLAQAKEMIGKSHVSQDLRRRVFMLLESAPQSEQYAEDIREVLRNVPEEALRQYDLSRQAIDLIDALPEQVTDNDERYAIVKELLQAYPAANEEIKQVLQSIQDHPDNSINIPGKWPAFVKQIKSTQYYKQYYDKSWSIPYLNAVIDQALSRLQNASQHVELTDLIKKL